MGNNINAPLYTIVPDNGIFNKVSKQRLSDTHPDVLSRRDPSIKLFIRLRNQK